jgi:hypothetical protein
VNNRGEIRDEFKLARKVLAKIAVDLNFSFLELLAAYSEHWHQRAD